MAVLCYSVYQNVTSLTFGRLGDSRFFLTGGGGLLISDFCMTRGRGDMEPPILAVIMCEQPLSDWVISSVTIFIFSLNFFVKRQCF